MSTRSERDRQKSLQDKHQMILSQLLKDEDNKYCVDCDAKGPRWASWNLGIFLCIRCAGLHRNLGVHISRVKSVNLDTWTPEQIAMMQEMGNSRARAVYEANVQDNFRRPQSDSGLEAFIRSKYETKKYIAREWVPPKPKVPQPVFEEMPKKEKKKVRALQNDVKSEKTLPVAKAVRTESVAISRPVAEQKKPIPNLLELDDPVPAPGAALFDDPFGAFMGTTVTQPAPAQQQVAPNSTQPQAQQSNENLLGGLGNVAAMPNGDSNGFEAASAAEASDGKKSKESILALFGNTSQQQQQMHGVPGGMYMQPGGGGVQMGMFGAQPNIPNGMMQMGGGMNAGMGMQQAGGQMNMAGNNMNQLNMANQMNMQQMTNGSGAFNQMPQMSNPSAFNQMAAPQMSNAGGFNQINTGQMAQMNAAQMGQMNTAQMGQMNGMNSMQQMGQMPASSSMNNMQMPGMGGASSMYTAAPNNMYAAGQLQQAQQQMAALSMSGQQMQAASQYGHSQLGTVGAGAAGVGGAGGWGGMQQTGNTMSSNLWQ